MRYCYFGSDMDSKRNLTVWEVDFGLPLGRSFFVLFCRFSFPSPTSNPICFWRYPRVGCRKFNLNLTFFPIVDSEVNPDEAAVCAVADLVARADRAGASDVHLKMNGDGARVAFRLDGTGR